MKKYLSAIAVLLLCCCSLAAQQHPDAAREAQIKSSIVAASASIESLSCDFVQTKQLSLLASTLVSKGTMHYQKSDKLCWRYTTPYRYEFVLNGRRVAVRNEKSSNVIDTGSNRLFERISRIIVASVSGEGIFDSTDFNFSFTLFPDRIDVAMLPRSKQMAGMFESVTLQFSLADYSVDTVVMVEQGGDTTTIKFKNRKTNVPIDQSLFGVD